MMLQFSSKICQFLRLENVTKYDATHKECFFNKLCIFENVTKYDATLLPKLQKSQNRMGMFQNAKISQEFEKLARRNSKKNFFFKNLLKIMGPAPKISATFQFHKHCSKTPPYCSSKI